MLFALLSISLTSLASLASGEILSLERYLDQVKSKNGAYQAASSVSQAALLRSDEAGLLTTPTLFSNIQFGTDRSPRNNPTFEGTRADQQSFELGMSQMTSFGLSGRFFYNLSNTTIYGASSQFVPQPSYYLGRPTLELTQSFLRNGFGSETRAAIEASHAQAKITHHLEDYRAKMLLVQAEMAYWRLSAAREILTIQKENLERAQKLRDWNLGRAKIRLADRSDVLQAEANYRYRLMEHQSAIDEERAASDAFNSTRGSGAKSVQEQLISLSDAPPLKSSSGTEIQKDLMRPDAQSAVEGYRAASAAAQLSYDKNLPTLDLVGSMSLNGRSDSMSPAIKDSFKGSQNISGIALKFAMPLDLGQTSNDRAAYRAEVIAAETRRDRALFDEERDWADLVDRHGETKRRVDLAADLVLAQKEKYENERGRQSGGRSTTFMVLQFEQDYALAQAMRIRVQAELLSILAQMKVYKKAEAR